MFLGMSIPIATVVSLIPSPIYSVDSIFPADPKLRKTLQQFPVAGELP